MRKKVAMSHFQEALKVVRPSIDADTIKFYEEFDKKFKKGIERGRRGGEHPLPLRVLEEPTRGTLTCDRFHLRVQCIRPCAGGLGFSLILNLNRSRRSRVRRPPGFRVPLPPVVVPRPGRRERSSRQFLLVDVCDYGRNRSGAWTGSETPPYSSSQFHSAPSRRPEQRLHR